MDYRESRVKGRRPLGGYCSNPERDVIQKGMVVTLEDFDLYFFSDLYIR